MPNCRTCLYAGLEPATEADGWAKGGRFVRTCALGRRPAAQPKGCASWVRDPGEDLDARAFMASVRSAREAHP